MRIFLFFLLPILVLSSPSVAQLAPLPTHVKLEKQSDYAQYNADVLNCISWLEKQPLNSKSEEVKQVKAFLLQWMTGSPDVTIALRSFVTEYAKANPDLLLFFMCGWAKYVLNNPSASNETEFHLAGVKEMILVYKTTPAVKPDKKMDKLVQMEAKGELEKYVTEKVKE